MGVHSFEKREIGDSTPLLYKKSPLSQISPKKKKLEEKPKNLKDPKKKKSAKGLIAKVRNLFPIKYILEKISLLLELKPCKFMKMRLTKEATELPTYDAISNR